MRHYWLIGALIASACTTEEDLGTTESSLGSALPNNLPFLNPLGASATWSADGRVDLTNEFFLEFGTNGRTCATCHAPTDGWTVSADNVRLRFLLTAGQDPIFRTNDGSVSPNADVSTLRARGDAYAMLINRGAIRVGLPVPETAEFELVDVDDPYGYASDSDLSLFRRPLPSTNLGFMAGVMWDGRVTGSTIHGALSAQADGATQGHAQSPDPLPPEANESIVNFESHLFNAQILGWRGSLTAEYGRGGPEALATQAMVADRFNLFDAWQTSTNPARQAVYRGQELFNTRRRTTGGGACQGCHNVQNVGTSKNGAFFAIGVSDGKHRTADLPLYTLVNKTTGETVQTTDPGRALITGLWRDIGRFKVPSIRGLGARAPYFHNGSAKSLRDVVKFYEANVNFSFTPGEEDDLVAFLSAL